MSVDWTELDLSTAEFPGGYGTYSDGAIHSVSGGYPDFRFPMLAVDFATTYAIQVDFDTARSTGSTFYVYAQQPDPNTSSTWYDLAAVEPSQPQGRLAFTIGPGIEQWASAQAAGESHLMFEGDPSGYITGVRIAAVDPADFTTSDWHDDSEPAWVSAGRAQAGHGSGSFSYGQTQYATASGDASADMAELALAAWSATTDGALGSDVQDYNDDAPNPFLRGSKEPNGLVEWQQVWTVLVSQDASADDGVVPVSVYESEFDDVVGIEWEPSGVAVDQRMTLSFGATVTALDGDLFTVHMGPVSAGANQYLPGAMSAAAISSMATLGTVTYGRDATIVTSGIPLPLSGEHSLPLTMLDPFTETQTPQLDGAGNLLGRTYSFGARLERAYRPRYRLIHAGPPPAPVTTTRATMPPLRQYPRSDGLGISGVKRVYPRPSSRQASNRRIGGYF